MAEWSAILLGAAIGAVSVIIGTIIVPIINHVKEKKSTEQKAHYLAIRIISILDQFIKEKKGIPYKSGYSLD